MLSRWEIASAISPMQYKAMQRAMVTVLSGNLWATVWAASFMKILKFQISGVRDMACGWQRE